MALFAGYRYRCRVLKYLDGIYSTIGKSYEKPAQTVMQITFQGRRNAAIESMRNDALPPHEAAVSLACVSIRHIVATQDADSREMALYALKTDNRSNHFANHLISLIENIRLLGGEIYADRAIYEAVGSLEGRTGEDLDNYCSGQMLQKIIDGAVERDARENCQRIFDDL